MEDQNPIYKYLSDNGMTDLDEKSFMAKYSKPENGAKIYEYIKSQGMTDLGQEEFLSKYLSEGGDSMGKLKAETVSTESLEESVSGGGGLTETVGSVESQEFPSDFGLTQEAIDQYKALSEKKDDVTDKSRRELVESGATPQQAQKAVPFNQEQLEEGIEQADFILETDEETANQKLQEVKGEIAKLKGELETYNSEVEKINEQGGTTPEIAEELKNRGAALDARAKELTEEQTKYAEARTYRRAQRGGMVGSMAKEFGRGAIEVVEGAARLISLGSQLTPTGRLIPDEVFDKQQDLITTGGNILELGMLANAAVKNDPISRAMTATTKEYIENKYENGTLLEKAALSLSRSAPAMVSGSVGLVAQSTAAGYDSIDQAAGDKLTKDEKMAYATTYGLVVGSLERLGLLGTFASKTKLGNFVNRVVQRAGEKGVSLGSKAVDDLVKEVATPMIRAGIAEGATEGAQEAAGIGMEQAVNAIKDEKIFEEFDYQTALDRIWESTKIGAVAGNAMVTPIAAMKAASVTAREFGNIKKAVEPEVAQASMELVDAKEDAGDITAEQAAEFKGDIAQTKEIVDEIPDNLTDEQSAKAFGLIKERKQLEAQIEGKDKALTVPQQERVKAINEELTNLVTPKTEQDETQRNEEELRQEEQQKEGNEEVETQEEVTDGTETQEQEEPLLEGVQDGRNQEEAGQESAELRTEAQEEVVDKPLGKNKRRVVITLDEGFLNTVKRTPTFQRIFSKEQLDNLSAGENTVDLNQTAFGKAMRMFGENAVDITNETRNKQDAKEQQSEPLQTEATTEGEVQEQRDSDMPILDEAELQDGTEIEEEVQEEIKLTAEQRKKLAAENIDSIAEKLKSALKVDLPEGTKLQGVGVDQLVDLAAQFTKALVNTGIDVQEAIRRVTNELKNQGAIDESQIPILNKKVLDKVQPEKKVETPKGKKERRAAKRTREYAAEQGVRIDKTDKDFYTPENQAKLLEKIETFDDASLQGLLNDKGAKQSVRVLAGIELFRRQIANNEDTKQTRDTLTALGTDVGQAAAMFAQLKTATPEGVVMMVQELVEDMGREISNQSTQPKSGKVKRPIKNIKQQSKEIANKVRRAKFVKTKEDLSKLKSDPTALFQVAWDGAIEAFATSIELTGDVFQAVDNALEKIKESDWYNGLSKSGKEQAEKILRKDLEEEGLKHSKTGREILSVRKKLQENESQLEKLRGLAEELIEAQGGYVELGRKIIEGDSISEAELKNAERRLDRAQIQMNKFINAVLPRTWGDLLSTTVKGSLLIVKSLVKNPIYNIGRLAAQIPSEMIGEFARRATNLGSDLKNFILGRPKSKDRGRVLFSLSAYAYGLRYGLPKGLKEAFFKFATGNNAANPNFEYQMNRGFMPMRAWLAALSNTKLGDAMGVERNLMSVKSDGTVSLDDRLKKIYEGTFGINAELMFRLLPFGDNPFYRLTEFKELHIIAKERGLKGEAFRNFMKWPPKDALEEASQMSKESVYQEDSAFSDWALKFTRQPVNTKSKFINNVAEAIFGFVFPYVKTPANVVSQTADFAIPPYSLAKSFYYFWSYRKTKSQSDLRKAYEYLGKMTVGAMMVDAAVILWANGLITGALFGSGDDDERKERDLVYGTGQRPATINITGLKRLLSGEDPTYRDDDFLMDYRAWGPLGAIMGMQATYKTYEKRRDTKQKNRNVIGRQSKQISEFFTEFGNIPAMVAYSQDQSFLAGTNAALEALKMDNPRSVENWMLQMWRAASTVALPNNLSAANRARSEFMRDLRDPSPIIIGGVDTGISNSFVNVILDRTFQTSDLPLRYDYFGNPIKNTPEGANPWVYHFLDPFSTSTIKSQEVAKEMDRVLRSPESGADISMIQSMPSWSFTYKGERYQMDNKEYNDFIKERQSYMTEEMEKLFKSSSYRNSDDAKRAEKIKREFSKVSGSSKVKKLKKEMVERIKERENN